MVFGLASRQTEGFIRSRLAFLRLDNDAPDHTTISRRKAKLGKVSFSKNQAAAPVHILIHSSGLAVHVDPLWKRPRSRDYRKTRRTPCTTWARSTRRWRAIVHSVRRES